MEMRDPYTAEHEQAVAALAVEIAEELQFDTDAVAALERVLDRD